MVVHSYEALKAEAVNRRAILAPLKREMEHDENFLQASAKWGDRRMLQYFNGIPKQAELKMLSTAEDIVNTGLAQYVIGERASITVVLPKSAHDDVKLAEEHRKRLQEALEALNWHIETYSTEVPYRTAGQHALGLGAAVLAYPLVLERWGSHPMKKKGGGYRREPEGWTPKERQAVSLFERKRLQGIPWDVHVEHPRRCLWDIHHDPPEDMMIESSVIPSPYLDRYPHLQQMNSRAKTAKLFTYCSAD